MIKVMVYIWSCLVLIGVLLINRPKKLDESDSASTASSDENDPEKINKTDET